MRVLYFSRSYTTHDRRFLAKIAEWEHEVHFLRLYGDGERYEMRPLPEGVREVRWQGARPGATSPTELLPLVPELENILRDVAPDLVHAGPVQTCGWLAALAGVHPLVSMSWGSDILIDADRDPLSNWTTRYALRAADVFVCDCDAVRHKARALAGIAHESVVQFPWGIEPDVFTPGASRLPLRRQLGWDDAFVILSTRSWEPIYAIDVLLEAFLEAYSRDSRLRLVLAGGGSQAGEVSAFVAEHGLQDVVHRPGQIAQQELPDYFRLADLYLSTTLSDGTSISLLEAMATALPVIVVDAPGNREWVEPGEHGWLTPPRDSAACAEHILAALRLSEGERRRMGRVNRSVVERRADWDANVVRLDEAYRRVAA